jgi:ribosomal protein S18 acetylase RimI-like enzyme
VSKAVFERQGAAMASSGKKWKIRPYDPQDREACLKIFDSNLPEAFKPDERADFEAFLEKNPEEYLVVEADGGELAACGGYGVAPEGDAATLCWGMVDTKQQGQGVGRLLLMSRLSALAKIPPMRLVRLDTSQQSVEFFMVKGFRTYRITQDYYGPKLNRYEMFLLLDDENIRKSLIAWKEDE